MKVTGSATVGAPRDLVWEALRDPRVLVRTLPGCRRLERVADDEYAVTVEVGVASVRGIYDGRVAITDPDPPHAYTLKAAGQGAPGTVDATARITLADADGAGTRIDYDAEAIVGGTIAGVGQRMLVGAARRQADAFFAAVEAHLAEPALAEEAPAAEPAAEAEGPSGGVGEVFTAPARPAAAPASPAALALAAAVGAALALAGVLVGARLARRR